MTAGEWSKGAKLILDVSPPAIWSMECSAILGDFAAALTLAGIFRFATHVAGLAAALAFATIEAFAVMLRGGAVVAGAGA
jgi:hypothetical protein